MRSDGGSEPTTQHISETRYRKAGNYRVSVDNSKPWLPGWQGPGTDRDE